MFSNSTVSRGNASFVLPNTNRKVVFHIDQCFDIEACIISFDCCLLNLCKTCISHSLFNKTLDLIESATLNGLIGLEFQANSF